MILQSTNETLSSDNSGDALWAMHQDELALEFAADHLRKERNVVLWAVLCVNARRWLPIRLPTFAEDLRKGSRRCSILRLLMITSRSVAMLCSKLGRGGSRSRLLLALLCSRRGRRS